MISARSNMAICIVGLLFHLVAVNQNRRFVTSVTTKFPYSVNSFIIVSTAYNKIQYAVVGSCAVATLAGNASSLYGRSVRTRGVVIILQFVVIQTGLP